MYASLTSDEKPADVELELDDDGEPELELDSDGEAALAAGSDADSELGAQVAPGIIEQRFVVEGECHGWRLDRFLQKRMRRLSRARVQRVIHGDCEVEGRKARPGMRVYFGQHVAFRRPAPPEPEVPRGLAVVYTDPRFYVIHKPAGLPMHPSARYHFSTLTAVLRERFPDERLQIAHRLDRETSGLLLIGRDVEAAVRLKGAFAKRRVEKRYLAVVHGEVADDLTVVDEPIGAAGGVVRVRMAVRPIEAGGQPAKTTVRVLERLDGYTLLECRPHTGRQHQIRVHLDHLGHPIVGDKLYPDEELFLRWAQGGDEALRVESELLLPRHALHAAGLSFPHPTTGETVTVSCELPDELSAFVARHAR